MKQGWLRIEQIKTDCARQNWKLIWNLIFQYAQTVTLHEVENDFYGEILSSTGRQEAHKGDNTVKFYSYSP